jgi:hypothetical protein
MVEQDRWGAETKFKTIRLSVGENDLVLEGEHLTLDADTFKLIDIWVKAIAPEAPQQAAIDALATTVGTKAADLQAVVDANKGK